MLLAAAQNATAAEGRLYAVVVGINKYLTAPLAGARADAEDIARALRGLGAEPTVLLDDDANRRAILAALDAATARAQPGDTVLFTYAGHGSQLPARDPASESDGKDEFLVLGRFSAAGPGQAERVLDDEIADWVAAVQKRGARPVVVFDSCHSGTATRGLSAGKRIYPPGARALPIAIDGPDTLAEELAQKGPMADGALPDGAFAYSAVRDDQQVIEVTVGRQARGAFSLAFANALRGRADRNGDGWVSHGELKEYLLVVTRSYVDSIQQPVIEPAGKLDEPLFRVAGVTPAGADLAALAGAPLRLRVIGPKPVAPPPGAQVLAADDPQPADLQWNVQTGQVSSIRNDLVAQDIDASRIAGVVEKWRGLGRIAAVLAEAPVAMRAFPDDSAHPEKSTIGFAVQGVNGAALTLFNLSGSGEVNFLYPTRNGDALTVARDYREEAFADVTPPFGADHVIAVLTRRPAVSLHAELKKLDGRVAAGAAVDAALAAVKNDPEARLGIQAILTRPR